MSDVCGGTLGHREFHPKSPAWTSPCSRRDVFARCIPFLNRPQLKKGIIFLEKRRPNFSSAKEPRKVIAAYFFEMSAAQNLRKEQNTNTHENCYTAANFQTNAPIKRRVDRPLIFP